MNKCKRKVIKHLKGDAFTWASLEQIARREKKSDLKLIRKLRRR